jgi:hypothetical protein
MPEPIIKFDPDGSARLLSYRPPDATSYPGRHYVRLELDPGVLRPEVEMGDATDGQVRVGRAGAVAPLRGEAASAERPNLDPVLAEPQLPAGVGVRALPDDQLDFHSASPLDPALASLRRDDLVALRDAGSKRGPRQLRLHRQRTAPRAVDTDSDDHVRPDHDRQLHLVRR